MSESFLNIVRSDLKYIVNSDFSTELTITDSDENEAVVLGYSSIHSMSFDADGNPYISDNAHVSFIEKDVTDLGLVTRDVNNDLCINEWSVTFLDANGTVLKFTLSEPMPDKGLGIICVKIAHRE